MDQIPSKSSTPAVAAFVYHFNSDMLLCSQLLPFKTGLYHDDEGEPTKLWAHGRITQPEDFDFTGTETMC